MAGMWIGTMAAASSYTDVACFVLCSSRQIRGTRSLSVASRVSMLTSSAVCMWCPAWTVHVHATCWASAQLGQPAICCQLRDSCDIMLSPRATGLLCSIAACHRVALCTLAGICWSCRAIGSVWHASSAAETDHIILHTLTQGARHGSACWSSPCGDCAHA